MNLDNYENFTKLTTEKLKQLSLSFVMSNAHFINYLEGNLLKRFFSKGKIIRISKN